jgi:hypothetical protein
VSTRTLLSALDAAITHLGNKADAANGLQGKSTSPNASGSTALSQEELKRKQPAHATTADSLSGLQRLDDEYST